MDKTLEEMVREHKELSMKIEVLEEERKRLAQSILQTMEGKMMQVGPYCVRRCNRLSIAVTLEQARIFNATKMEEIVDKEKLKKLSLEGASIPGIKPLEYVQISLKP